MKSESEDLPVLIRCHGVWHGRENMENIFRVMSLPYASQLPGTREALCVSGEEKNR